MAAAGSSERTSNRFTIWFAVDPATLNTNRHLAQVARSLQLPDVTDY